MGRKYVNLTYDEV